MDISIFLAKVIGLFLVISTLAIIIRYKKFVSIEEEAAKNKILIYLSGFIALIIGILLIISHNIWVLDWRVVITLIGWMVFVKGVLRIFFPELAIKIIGKKSSKKWLLWAEVIFFLIGLYLIYKGFF